MSDAEKAYQATPTSTLKEEIMNPCIAKNQREWWAAAEIERLRAALRDLFDASERHIFSTEYQKERDAARAVLAQEKPHDRDN